jgi:hypothetical protein
MALKDFLKLIQAATKYVDGRTPHLSLSMFYTNQELIEHPRKPRTYPEFLTP